MTKIGFKKIFYLFILAVSVGGYSQNACGEIPAAEPSIHEKAHRFDDSFSQTVEFVPLKQMESGIGVKENLGKIIPLELSFYTEDGVKTSLADLLKKPTLILPVYFNCPNSCPLLLANLAGALNGVVAVPGEGFQVIAFSFDHRDLPEDAIQAKKNYLPLLKKNFPASSWTFLTGDKESIRQLTEALGFSFQQSSEHQFIHPSVLISLAAEGKIIRYIYGPNFLPFDLSMALYEAEKGTPGISIKKMLNYCFSYDPQEKKYVFNIFRVAATSIFLVIVMFYFFFLRKGNRRKEQ